ncbi:MAG: class I SAM-dependent methyltransferase [Verrucomicrobia bacterium]|nr:class I SAM-dependent methyltransferase [Verrucomicrobiota bacterium]MBS0636882.1 class I SAM-dependent methyltransferase [Verrucomicrobiota bacterium]
MISSIRSAAGSYLAPFVQRTFLVPNDGRIAQIARRAFSTGWDNDRVQINPLLLKQLKETGKTMESYGKLSSECYGVWFPENQEYEDAALYRKYIQKSSQPALEVGCGDGRLLIPYVAEGLQVEGVDLSPYMIENCRKRAEKRGLSVTLHEQAMQNLDLPQKYGTIYIPYGSFMLVSDPKESQEAVRRFFSHLAPGGHLMVSLFIPTEHDIHVAAPKQDEWRLRREGQLPNGNVVRVWEKPFFDLKQQLECAEYRYDILSNGKVIGTEFERLTLRWYSQPQFAELLKRSGFSAIECFKGHSEEAAKSDESEFTFVAKKQ